MTLSDDIQDFQRSLLHLNESLEEIDKNSAKLLSCPMDELSTQLTSLSELLDEAYAELKRSQAQIDLLGDLWGGASFSSKSRSSKQSPWKETFKKSVAAGQVTLTMLTGLATQGTTTIVNTLRDVVLPAAEVIDRLPPQLTEIDTEDSSDRSQQDLISLYEMEQATKHQDLHNSPDERKRKKKKDKR